MNNIKVTTEMIEALALLRAVWHDDATQRALDTLDNAGIFHLIDTATDYDVDPEPTRAPARRACPNQGCTGEFAVNKNGSLRAHTNDMCQPCK